MDGEPHAGEADSAPPCHRTARRRRLWLLAAVLALAGIVAAVAGWAPWAATAVVRRVLRAQGLPFVQVHVQRLTACHLLASVEIADTASYSRIERLDIRFSPVGLLRSRIGRIVVSGGTIQFQASTNGLALCGWPSQRPPRPATRAKRRRPWQVQSLLVDHVLLRLWPAQTNAQPADARLTVCGVSYGPDFRFAVTVDAAQSIMANGHLRFGTDRIRGQFTVPQPRLSGPGWTVSARDMTLAGDLTVARSRFVAARGTVDLAGGRIDVKGVRCDGEVRGAFEARAPFDSAAVTLTGRRVSVALPDGTSACGTNAPVAVTVRAAVDGLSGGRAAVGVRGQAELAPLAFSLAVGELTMAAPLVLDLVASGAQGAGSGWRWAAASSTNALVWSGADGSHITASLAIEGTASGEGAPSGQVRLTHMTWAAAGVTGGMASAGIAFSPRAASLPDAAAFPLCVEVRADEGWARQDPGVSIEGLAFRLPLDLGADGVRAAGTPELAWRRLGFKGVQVISQDVSVTGEGRSVAARLKVALEGTGLSATLDARADWRHAWKATVLLEVPPTVLADTDGWRRATRALTGTELSVTGQVSAKASASLSAGRPPAVAVTVAVTNLDVACQAMAWEVTGLSARLEVDHARAWRTPPGQEVSFRSAMWSGMPVDGGQLRWQFRRETVLLEKAELKWCGGMLRAYGVQYDWRAPNTDIIVYADRIDLERLMALIHVMSGRGSGSLYGRMQARLDHGNLRFSEGFLYSLPGEKGALHIDAAGPIDDALAQSGVSDKVREQLRKALHDLNFSMLRLDFDPGSGGEAALRLRVAGTAGADSSVPPVDLNVNVKGPLEALFNVGLRTARKYR